MCVGIPLSNLSTLLSSDNRKFDNPIVCMYEHTPGHVQESQHLLDLNSCPHESLQENAISFFHTLERVELSVLRKRHYEILIKRD